MCVHCEHLCYLFSARSYYILIFKKFYPSVICSRMEKKNSMFVWANCGENYRSSVSPSLSGVSFSPFMKYCFPVSQFLPVDSTHSNTASSDKINKTWIPTNNRASQPSSRTITRWGINHEMREAKDAIFFFFLEGC